MERLASVNDRGMSKLSRHGVSRQPKSARRDKLSGGRHCRRPDKAKLASARPRLTADFWINRSRSSFRERVSCRPGRPLMRIIGEGAIAASWIRAATVPSGA
jgi:hypothetical protein